MPRRRRSGAPPVPPATPGAPPARAPGRVWRRPPKRRSRWLILAAAVLVGIVVVTAVVGPGRIFCGGIPLDVGSRAYDAQPDRNAEWGATRTGPYSDAQIDAIAESSSYFFIPKFAENFDINKQFDDVRRLKAAASKHGHDIKVFMYINAQYWLNVNADNWKPYSDDFRKSYLLDDSRGTPVPYYGQTGTAGAGDDPIGYLVDLSNPAYRKYILQVALGWLKQAPLDGIVFDSANPLLGDQVVRRGNGDGTSTANQLLCGADAKVDANGDCDRVASWNDGLSDLLQSMSDAFAPDGKEVVYNGVAPSKLRDNRNVANLAHATGASNEGFCYKPSISNNTKLDFNSVTDDAQLMQQAASQGKKLFEITNFQSDQRNDYGAYCLGAFLMGWQPDSSFFIYHRGYSTVETELPIVPDQDLQLGDPSSVDFQQQGDAVLHRNFEHGFVAVNISDKPAQFTTPRAGSQYDGGKLIGRAGKGDTITMPARSSVFFLDNLSVPAIGSAVGVC